MQSVQVIDVHTSKIPLEYHLRTCHFLVSLKLLFKNLGLKAEKQLQNLNHTKD